jgi:hypothetical protein
VPVCAFFPYPACRERTDMYIIHSPGSSARFHKRQRRQQMLHTTINPCPWKTQAMWPKSHQCHPHSHHHKPGPQPSEKPHLMMNSVGNLVIPHLSRYYAVTSPAMIFSLNESALTIFLPTFQFALALTTACESFRTLRYIVLALEDWSCHHGVRVGGDYEPYTAVSAPRGHSFHTCTSC